MTQKQIRQYSGKKTKNRVKNLMSVIAARFNLDRAFLAVKGLQMFLIGGVFYK